VCCGLRLLLKLILAVAAFSGLFAAVFLPLQNTMFLEPPPNLIETKMVGFWQQMSGKEMCFHCQEKCYVSFQVWLQSWWVM